ncbi:MAG: DUF5131 family protein [Saprospiraceae bacterium]|nr:DUF5131 family protein [Candidatus Defluviibacterium haderslevense]
MNKTHIQWSDYSWNPWMGCRRVSAGCDNCYMHRILNNNNSSLVCKSFPSQFMKPYGIAGNQKIFTCSMSDFFIEEADPWRDEAWDIIRNTPQHTYLILTKRVGRIKHCLPADWGNGYPNVILGTSIEEQKVINRMVTLSKLKTPQSKFKLFISAEPLIGQIDFIANQKLINAFQKMDWIIAGGESGDAPVGTPGIKYCYRPCDLKWIKKIIDDCKQYNIPFFLKQVGNHLAKFHGLIDKKGGDINEWDPNYQIRQWP